MVMSRESERIVEQWEQVQEQKRMEAKMGSPEKAFIKIMKQISKPKSKPKPKKK
jgi:hypothetical protein